MPEGPLFILAGNSPYLNRGCEAIVRGTVSILRQHYRDPRIVAISHFNSREELENQRRNEIDGSIQHLSTLHLDKRSAAATIFRPSTWSYIYRSVADPRRLGRSVYRDVLPLLGEAEAVLSIAGDNYSLDYGVPRLFVALDDLVLDEGRKLFIWGASVGPFGRMPEYERFMSGHLKRVTGILARESATVDYLEGIGVKENVHRTADPAFLMEAVKPLGIEDDLPLYGEAVGLNLSPLLAKQATGGDLGAWTAQAASIIRHLAERLEMPLYLIPHATRECSDDHGFMRAALAAAGVHRGKVILVPPYYNAAETKWIIGRMTAFAGARTHSVIASLSSLVPTLSFASSLKSQGINRDLFGSTKYCLDPSELDPAAVADRLSSMLDERESIRRDLAPAIAGAAEAAGNAGAVMKRLIS